jgi:hypothetical protein
MFALFTEEEVAKQLHVSIASLRRWRLEQRGASFINAGSLVRYRPEEIESWLSALPTGMFRRFHQSLKLHHLGPYTSLIHLFLRNSALMQNYGVDRSPIDKGEATRCQPSPPPNAQCGSLRSRKPPRPSEFQSVGFTSELGGMQSRVEGSGNTFDSVSRI